MGSVHFYLKKPITTDKDGKKRKDPSSLIYLQYKYNGKKLLYSFGQTINPKNWNFDRERVKNNSATTDDGKHLLNELLESLEKECERAYNNEIKNGIPEPGKLRKHLDDFRNRDSIKKEKSGTLYDLIAKFESGEIKYKGKSKTAGTLKTYTTTLNHLKEFEAKKKYRIDFDTIDRDFYNKFADYLEKKGLMLNTIGRNIKDIKTFMSEAFDMDLTTNLSFKKKYFVTPREESDSVYLTETEILKLYRYDLSKKKSLEQVRDLFVFGCFVGLRFSDYSDIKPENIVQIDGEYFIKVKAKKTSEEVIIPTNPIILEIFKKYDDMPNNLPKSISNQKFNKYIKDVLKDAGFEELGRLSKNMVLPLYECVSSHTARRSFATNYYLQGFPTIDLMKITGHKSEKNFLKYIRVSKLDSAKRLSAHNKKHWSAMMMRVA
jgi:integrase